MQYKIEYAAGHPQSPFCTRVLADDRLTLTINNAHPFFGAFYVPALGAETKGRLAIEAMNLVLFAIARSPERDVLADIDRYLTHASRALMQMMPDDAMEEELA